MKTIRVADMTLRAEAEAPFILCFKEKLEVARELDRLGVDVIETAPIRDGKTDPLLIRTIASMVKRSTLSCPVGWSVESLGDAWDAVKGAVSPRLLVTLPVSAVQMEYLCHRKPAALAELAETLVREARALTENVEFAAEDATRAEPAFLREVLGRAAAAGAAVITVCDSAGTMMPGEFRAFLEALRADVPALEGVTLSVQCGDAMDMATACVFASVAAGAGQVKCAVAGKGLPGLEQVAGVFRARGDDLGIGTELDMTNVNRAVKRVRGFTDATAAPSPLRGAFASIAEPAEQIRLDSATDLTALGTAVAALGYDLSGDDLVKVFDAFRRIAEKKQVGARELDAIVASAALQVPATYRLVSYVINSGNTVGATAHIKLERDGQVLTGLTAGDGPIDAALMAIEQILGHHYELEDFQIQAVTEGREAMGSALVKLRSGGKLFSGQGVSTDIIGAAILAYLDSLNKIVYEERAD